MTNGSSGELNGLDEHCRRIVRDFLLTAVVVDDELSASAGPQVHGDLAPPDQRSSNRPTQTVAQDHPSRPLNVDPITWSFARHGMVCGVVAPQQGQGDLQALAKAVARADIVILDWRLSRQSGADALPLLERIIKADQPGRLRLIAFYTGEPDQQDIRRQIADCLDGLDLPHRAVHTNDDRNPIDFGPCRIVVYGKPGSTTAGSNTVVNEAELADRLVADVAAMANGLLPSLVLTALTAVRENVYRVLNRFGNHLDPAFLAHRAFLQQPSDSEQHIVQQIASELRGIMDDTISKRRPAGLEAITHWLTERFCEDQIVFHQNHKATVGEVLDMLTDGYEEKPPASLQTKKGKKRWDLISHGLAGGTGNARELDRLFAFTMSFRQVLDTTSRQLSMGTVVSHLGHEDRLLLCVTPRCDSIRLTESASFLFVPLAEPKSRTLQVVVPVGAGRHRRMTISANPSEWLIRCFEPDPERQYVLAAGDGSEREFIFRDVDDERYRWVGELKPEFAQSIAQTIAERMSRLPLNKSEWLRRSESIGQRAN